MSSVAVAWVRRAVLKEPVRAAVVVDRVAGSVIDVVTAVAMVRRVAVGSNRAVVVHVALVALATIGTCVWVVLFSCQEATVVQDVLEHGPVWSPAVTSCVIPVTVDKLLLREGRQTVSGYSARAFDHAGGCEGPT